MDRKRLKDIIEGLVFSHPEPVGVTDLASAIADADIQLIRELLGELEAEYDERDGGFTLRRIGGGYQFRTAPRIAPWILEMRKAKPSRLSRASLEALSIVAYNQPVTRAEVERIRGVESSAIMRNLVERGMIEAVGRKDVPGRPILYGTTNRFLEIFGLPDLASLPPLPEESLDVG